LPKRSGPIARGGSQLRLSLSAQAPERRHTRLTVAGRRSWRRWPPHLCG
jgi:hypothetical protein